jgi:hypothetical protein
VNKVNINSFSNISIRGRFIYGCLCLNRIIYFQKLSKLPEELDNLLHEFLTSDKLDDWQFKVNDILPSFLLETNKIDNEYFTQEVVLKVKNYYISQPDYFVDFVDNLFFIGLSNLYIDFNTEYTLSYLKLLLQTMEKYVVPLPDSKLIVECSIEQRHGWGDCSDLDYFLSLDRY